MTSTRHSHVFSLLDGLRGVAAMAVAVLHMPRVFDGFEVPNAHLAVDFFLQLSGFVIAFAYSERVLRGMKFGDFAWRRFNRLFPSYLIGLGLGLLVAIAALRFSGNGLSVEWTRGGLVCAATFNLLMLPALGCEPKGLLFPLNPPMWSIFYELLANFIFFLLISVMLRRRVVMAATAALFAVMVALTWQHTLDTGFVWRNFAAGFIRAMFSFLVGVTVFNFRLNTGRQSNLVFFALVFLLGAALLMQTSSYEYELLMVTLVFPVIVCAGVKFNPSGGFLTWLCLQLGKTSYVLYVIHKPLYQLLYGAILKFSPGIVERAGISLGIGMLIVISIGAWGLAVIYEPTARTLMNMLLRRSQVRSEAA